MGHGACCVDHRDHACTPCLAPAPTAPLPTPSPQSPAPTYTVEFRHRQGRVEGKVLQVVLPSAQNAKEMRKAPRPGLDAGPEAPHHRLGHRLGRLSRPLAGRRHVRATGFNFLETTRNNLEPSLMPVGDCHCDACHSCHHALSHAFPAPAVAPAACHSTRVLICRARLFRPASFPCHPPSAICSRPPCFSI